MRFVQIRFFLPALFLWTLAAQVQPQEAYSFKKNYLGMSLSEFTTANATDEVWINSGRPGIFGHPDKKKSIAVKTPLCTDTMRDFPGDPRTLVDKEVACNISPGKANPDGLVIGGKSANSVLYRFYEGRLYQIEIAFYANYYGDISTAFRQKYGVPTVVNATSYQNGYGASWKGEVLGWKSFTQIILIAEGPANGPGQNSFESRQASGIIFQDTALQPPTAAPPVNF